MHGLSVKEDLSFLVGAEVIQVGIGFHDAILYCSGQVHVAIFSDFCLANERQQERRFEDAREGGIALLSLLGDSIKLAEATADGNLRVVFTSGAELTVIDTSDCYHSFRLVGPTTEIQV